MTFVKICGLTDRRAVEAAAAAGADAAGLVCVEKSPRYVEEDRALELARLALDLGMTPVFVVTDRAGVLYALKDGAIEGPWVQLHGGEDVHETRWIASYTRAPIIKAVPVTRTEDLDAAAEFDAADRLLLDAKAPDDADYPGGHGKPFDWSLLKDWTAPKPWILSGGLTPETVAEAIAATGATAVDVSSGVESAPGVKDLDKVRAFVAAAKAAQPNGASGAAA